MEGAEPPPIALQEAAGCSFVPFLLLRDGTPIQGRRRPRNTGMNTILLIVLVLLLVGALPAWPHSSGWGYGPSGGLGLVLVILLILVLMGKI